jgi:hypothetical protein
MREIKNKRASYYKRRWMNAASRVSKTDLEVKLIVSDLKLNREFLDSDALCSIIGRLRKLRDTRKNLHRACRKYKFEYLINNQG